MKTDFIVGGFAGCDMHSAQNDIFVAIYAGDSRKTVCRSKKWGHTVMETA